MAAFANTVEVTACLLVSPSGLLILAASAPNLDPFKRIDPAREHLWVRLVEANGQHAQNHPRVEFATRAKPYTTGTTPRPIAHSPELSGYSVRGFRLLAIQRVADLMMAQEPAADDVCNTLLHLIAFIEPPSYDWNRNQALCAQFEADRRSARRPRSDAGGAVRGRQSRHPNSSRVRPAGSTSHRWGTPSRA